MISTCKHNIRSQLLGWILLLVCSSASPQTFPFQKLSVEDGLSHNVSRKIIQDDKGFIWVATQDGLNRYDGYHFKKYFHQPENPRSLSSNDIYELSLMRDGRLLIGTAKGGLNIYQPECDCFSHYMHDAEDSTSIMSNFVMSAYEDRKGQIWLGTNRGLDKMEVIEQEGKRKTIFKHYNARKGDEQSLIANGANAMVEDVAGRMWFASLRFGLSRLDQDAGQTEAAVFKRFYSDGFPNVEQDFFGEIRSLFLDHHGDLWIGRCSGVSRISAAEQGKDKPNIHHYDLSYFPTYTPDWFCIRSFQEDPQGQLWFMDNFGRHRYRRETNSFETYDYQPLTISERSRNMLYDMLIDQDGNTWLSSVEGIFKPGSANPHFKRLAFPDDIARACWGITTDQYGYLWVGTESDGLWVFDKEKNFYKHFSTQSKKPAERLTKNFITCLFEDSQGRIWVGNAGGGIDYLLPNRNTDGTINQIKVKALKLVAHQIVHDVHEDPQGRIWIAFNNDLFILDGTSLQVVKHLTKVSANSFVLQAQKKLFIATDKGLLYHESEADTLLPFTFSEDVPPSLHPRQIFDLSFQGKDSLFLSTIRGVVVVNVKTGTLKRFLEKDGLLGNQAHSVLQGKPGRFWVGTNKGLSQLDISGGQIRNFNRKDGIGSITLNRRAAHQDKEGNFYFGGTQGLVYFHPDSIRPNTTPPPVRLTDFQVFYEKVPVQFPDSTITAHQLILERPIDQLEEIRLPYRYRILSFEYVALNYQLAEKNQYAYQMEGFDESWVKAGTQRNVTYTNLDPGTYTFRVKASNSDGIWNEEGTSLRIIIDPPWWRSWWAYFLYGSVLMSFFGFYLYYRIRKVSREYETQARLEQARQAEREAVRKRSARDFHDEAGNKLTKLSLYTELTKRKVSQDPEAQAFLTKIENNVQELSSGMRDFIWVLDPEKDSLADTINRLKDFGEKLFLDSPTNFRHHFQLEQLQHIELGIKAKRHLLLIFKEAMNNCLKYAKADQAHLKVKANETSFQVIFTEDGQGFDLDKVGGGNGLKNMESRAREMGAEIHINSKPGKGSNIRLSMQITHLGYEKGRG